MGEILASCPSYICIKWSKDESTLDNRLQGSFISQEGLDMTLATVDCKKIKVHQLMMSSVSPFFLNILKDLESSCYPIIVLSGIKFEEIHAIVELLYNGEVIIEANRIEPLMKAAEILQIKGLTEGKSISEAVERLKKSQDDGLRGRRSKRKKKSTGNGQATNDDDDVNADDDKGEESNCDNTGELASGKRQSARTNMGEMRTATIATLSAPQAKEDGSLTATFTTQVVPIISTISIRTPRPVICDKCGIVCPNDTILRAHRKLHDKPQSRANGSSCGNSNNNNNSSDGSKKCSQTNGPKKPNRLKIHQCSYCPYASEHVTNLLHHIRTHTGEKPYKCYHCQRGFSRKATLLHHQRSHTGERPFQCDYCSKKFLFKHNLTSHIAALHSSDKDTSICPYCEENFTNKKALEKHLKVHRISSQAKYDAKTTNYDSGECVPFALQADNEEVVSVPMPVSIQVSVPMPVTVPIEIEAFPVAIPVTTDAQSIEPINL